MTELAIVGNEYSESSFDIFVNAIKTKIGKQIVEAS